ncbi:hypothetical protein Lesp02_70530 [Lentzea sp. NBRC 105346]|nr:hypothetical protein Lesp02_70530 [Lentzea sp. NBRC 105346]
MGRWSSGAEPQYLTVEQATANLPRYYGIPVMWIGERGKGIGVAITDDMRRGLAALHAMGRHDLGSPVRIEKYVGPTWLRFQWFSDPENWYTFDGKPEDPNAVRAVWAWALEPYRPKAGATQ